MSAKRYQYKVVEAGDAAELETQLRDLGAKMWSAVGYGVLPDGRRSVLLERKIKIRHSHHRIAGGRTIGTWRPTTPINNPSGAHSSVG